MVEYAMVGKFIMHDILGTKCWDNFVSTCKKVITYSSKGIGYIVVVFLFADLTIFFTLSYVNIAVI